LIFGKLAAVLGGRLRVLMSCGAPLNYFLITLNYRLIFGKLAAVLGGRLRVLMSGGGPLNYFLITS
jgi:long-subunit acyl-CoA synthetase (AMP-forming)